MEDQEKPIEQAQPTEAIEELTLATAPEDTPVTPTDLTDEKLTDSLTALLAEAEQRGYLRARNEIAAAAMRRPRLWENSRRQEADPSKPATSREETPDYTTDFLTRVRPSSWDL